MNRNEVARELAAKDGVVWEKLNPILVNAYLHNADEAIKDRLNPVTVEGQPAPSPFTCTVCEDKGWINDKPCLECNPVGLVNGVKPGPDDKVVVISEGPTIVPKEVASDTTDGAGPADLAPGGPDTGQPEQPAEPKAQGPTRKGARKLLR